jgi:hypothetical protein
VATGLAPSPLAAQSIAERSYFAWDYTTALNAIFVPLGLALFWIGRREMAHGSGHGG